MAIIKSVLDTDLYGLHQGDFFFHKHPDAVGEYAYLCRDATDLRHLRKPFMEQMEELSTLKITEAELEYLRANTFCSEAYLAHLASKPVFDHKVLQLGNEGNFSLRYRGEMHTKILWEPTLMAILSQLYFEDKHKDKWEEIHAKGKLWAEGQAAMLNNDAPEGFTFTEGGLRRRFSLEHQENVLTTLWQQAKPFVAGTSNVYLGMKHGIPIQGTIAHQLIMFYQTIVGLQDCNKQALRDWSDHHKDRLNVGLSDTLGNKKWDLDFRGGHMERYKTERWDSGDAYEWADGRLAALAREGCSTKGRYFNFSNDLNPERAFALYNHYHEKIGVKTLMGTYWTNTMEIPSHKAIPQVIKLMWATPDKDESPLRPTIKTGADVGKMQCECPKLKEFALQYLGAL